MPTRILPFVVSMSLICALRANASCVVEGLTVLEEDEVSVPPNPTLHVFATRPLEAAPASVFIAVDDQNRFLAVTPRRIFSAKEARYGFPAEVWELKIEVPAGRRFSIVLVPGRTVRFNVSTDWRAETSKSVAVTAVSEQQYVWTCSYQHSRDLTFSARAGLYVMEWAKSEAEYRRGVRSTVYLSQRAAEHVDPKQSPGRVEIGAIDCHAPNFEWPEGPIYAGFSALFPDGSRSPLPEVPIRLEPPSPLPDKR